MNKKDRVFSGTRPTGKLHLGNYFGAIKGYLALQNKKNLDCIYSVVDLHGITTIYEKKDLQTKIQDVVLDYLACGLNPQKCHLMIQSQVSEHVELAYLLGTITSIQRVQRLPAYKDKRDEGNPNNMGLLYYPILMAADILIYKSKLVPIGEDQEPHLRLAREIAQKFNKMFGEVFPLPKTYFTETKYIPSLLGTGNDEKKKKMSKSVEGSYILLTDDLKTIKERLAKVPTDIGYGKTIPKEGGVVSLLVLVELFMGKKAREDSEKQYLNEGIKYAELKDKLSLAIFEELKPIQEKRKYFEKHPEEVAKILSEGRVYCSKIAQQTLLEVKKAMGLA